MKSTIPMIAAALMVVACDKSEEVKPIASKVELQPVEKNPEIREMTRKLDLSVLLAQANYLVSQRATEAEHRTEMRLKKSKALMEGTVTTDLVTKISDYEKVSNTLWQTLDEMRSHYDRVDGNSDVAREIQLTLEQDDHLVKADKWEAEALSLIAEFQSDPVGTMKLTDALHKKANFELQEVGRLQRECDAIKARKLSQK